jgi:hypothetical protein
MPKVSQQSRDDEKDQAKEKTGKEKQRERISGDWHNLAPLAANMCEPELSIGLDTQSH